MYNVFFGGFLIVADNAKVFMFFDQLLVDS